MSSEKSYHLKLTATPTALGAPELTLELRLHAFPSTDGGAGTGEGSGTVTNFTTHPPTKLVGPLPITANFTTILILGNPTQVLHFQSNDTKLGAGSIQGQILLTGDNKGYGSYSYFDDRTTHTFPHVIVTVTS